VIPCLAGAERPCVGFGEAVALGVGRFERRELGARVGIERGPQGARELAGGQGAEDVDLGGLESLGDPLGLFEERLSAGAPGVDLDRNEDLCSWVTRAVEPMSSR